jgi:hypothetical protein
LRPANKKGPQLTLGAGHGVETPSGICNRGRGSVSLLQCTK